MKPEASNVFVNFLLIEKYNLIGENMKMTRLKNPTA